MCSSSVANLLNSKCLVLLRKKTAKAPCIIALKISLKRLSSNLYKCQIPFIKKTYPHNAFDVSWYRKNDGYSNTL